MEEQIVWEEEIISLLTQCRDILLAISGKNIVTFDKPTGKRMTFAALSKTYLDYSRSRVKQSTLATYENLLLISPFAKSLSDRDVSTLKYSTVQQWIDHFKEHTSYLRCFIVILRSMISWARDRDLCALPDEYTRPFKFKRMVRRGGGEEIEDGDYEKIVQYTMENLSKDRKYAAVFVALNTGMRIGEVCGLTGEDIEAEENIIHIRHTLKRIYSPITKKTKLVFGTPKSKTSQRDIPVSKAVVEACLLHDLKRKTLFDVEPRELLEFFRRMQVRAQCGKVWTFHSLRHTFVSREIRAGKNPKAVSKYVGHGNLDITLAVYTHVSADDLKEVVNGRQTGEDSQGHLTARL